MTNDETEIDYEQPRSLFATWIGVVLLFAVFGLLVWAVMGAVPHGDNYEKKRAEARVEKLNKVHEEANAALHSYGWVDKEKGLARVPIERAMELSMADLAQKKPVAANPIAPDAAAAGLQATAPDAPSPAPAISPIPASSPKATSLGGKDSEARGQPAAAANPPGVAPATQPGPSATPAASPPAPASKAQPNPAAPTVTPMRAPAGTPIPIPGKTP